MDALVFVDHSYPKELVGRTIISFKDLEFKFPNLKIGHIWEHRLSRFGKNISSILT